MTTAMVQSLSLPVAKVQRVVAAAANTGRPVELVVACGAVVTFRTATAEAAPDVGSASVAARDSAGDATVAAARYMPCDR